MIEMTNNDIQQIIFDAIEMINNAREDDKQIPVSAETELYGTSGQLDSMGLVSFLVDVEESFQDNDINISLSDERAMSQSRSPFRNVQSLTDYIATLIKEAE
jgi:acyl carrier protein